MDFIAWICKRLLWYISGAAVLHMLWLNYKADKLLEEVRRKP